MRNIKNFLFISRYFIPIITLGGDGASRLAVKRSQSRRWNVHSGDLLKSLRPVTSQLSWNMREKYQLRKTREISQTGKMYVCVKQKKKYESMNNIFTNATKYFDCIRWPLRMVNANNTEWTRRYSPKHIWARVTKTIATFGNIFHSILLNAW